MGKAIFMFVLTASLLRDCQASSSSTTTTDDVKVAVDSQGGNFNVSGGSRGKAFAIEVTMDALREVDANGIVVGTNESTDHSIENFTSQVFTVLPEETVQLQNVSAVNVSFNSSIEGVGKIRVDTYVFKQDGVVGPSSNETQEVKAGDVKWNIELSSWTWCGCGENETDEIGEFIDLNLSVKSQSNATKINDTSIAFDGGLSVGLSRKVLVDGVLKDMPEGYPKVAVRGSSVTLGLRFPKFVQSVQYGPVIRGLVSADGSSGSLLSHATSSVHSWPVILMLFTALSTLRF